MGCGSAAIERNLYFFDKKIYSVLRADSDFVDKVFCRGSRFEQRD